MARGIGRRGRGRVIGYTIAHSRAKAPEHGMVCGRGGIGRRAALRSLSGNTGGSSSLLDRTMSFCCIVKN